MEFMTIFNANLYARATLVFSPPDKFWYSVSNPFCSIMGVKSSFILTFMLSSGIRMENHFSKNELNSFCNAAITCLSIFSIRPVKKSSVHFSSLEVLSIFSFIILFFL